MGHRIHIRKYVDDRASPHQVQQSWCHYKAKEILVDLEQFILIRDAAPNIICRGCRSLPETLFEGDKHHSAFVENEGLGLLSCQTP